MRHRVLASSLAAVGASALLFALAPSTPAQEGDNPLDSVLSPGDEAAPSQAGGDVLNCDNFTFQEDAQDELNRDPSDPNGLDAHPGPADGNDQAGGDGIACEDLPHRPSAAAEEPAPAEPPTPVRGTARFTG
jgi:hypothetical protein